MSMFSVGWSAGGRGRRRPVGASYLDPISGHVRTRRSARTVEASTRSAATTASQYHPVSEVSSSEARVRRRTCSTRWSGRVKGAHSDGCGVAQAGQYGQRRDGPAEPPAGDQQDAPAGQHDEGERAWRAATWPTSPRRHAPVGEPVPRSRVGSGAVDPGLAGGPRPPARRSDAQRDDGAEGAPRRRGSHLVLGAGVSHRPGAPGRRRSRCGRRCGRRRPPGRRRTGACRRRSRDGPP